MNMRAAEDLKFAEMIRSIARGMPLWKIPSMLPGGLPECEDGFIWIPPFFRIVYSVDAAVDSLFQTQTTQQCVPQGCSSRAPMRL